MPGAFPTFLQGSGRREDREGLLTLLKDCFLSNTSREHPCCQETPQETHMRNVKFCVCCSPGREHLHPRGHDPGSTVLLTHSPAALHARDSWEAGLCRGRESGSTTTRRDDSCWSQISVDPAASSAQPCQTTLLTAVIFHADHLSLASWNLWDLSGGSPVSTSFGM